MTARSSQIWDPVLRSLHWVFACCFVMNYWVLAPGDFWHRAVGYLLFSVTILRLVWGFTGPPNARFNLHAFQLAQWRHHFQQISQRRLDPLSGHNPFGFVWLYLALSLFLSLATSGFLLEEVDYFFGSDRLEWLHGLLADVLFGLVCVHVLAVFIVQWWGKISLVKPMLTGKRRW